MEERLKGSEGINTQRPHLEGRGQLEIHVELCMETQRAKDYQ